MMRLMDSFNDIRILSPPGASRWHFNRTTNSDDSQKDFSSQGHCFDDVCNYLNHKLAFQNDYMNMLDRKFRKET